MLSDQAANQLYNKPEHRHILVGNWQEEQKLLETTGVHRYKASPLPFARSTRAEWQLARRIRPSSLPAAVRSRASGDLGLRCET